MKTILIMEDDPYHAKLMVRLLAHAGYQTEVAPDGESGLLMALESPPDLILLDMGLPDLDGQTVAGLLKGSEFLAQIPLVAVTAWPEDTAARMATAYGCNGYIAKPISARDFVGQVEAFM